MPRDDQKRSVRVAERIRAELMDLILRGGIRDPRVQGALVSSVRVSDDLSVARVYVRTLEQSEPKQREAVVAGLDSASGYIRRELGSKMKLRYTPELRFFWDDVVDSALRIEGLLSEIRTDEGGPAGDEPVVEGGPKDEH